MDVRSLLTTLIGVSLDTLLFYFCLHKFTKKYRRGVTAAGYFGYWLLNVIARYCGLPIMLISAVSAGVIVAMAYFLYRKVRLKSIVKQTMLCLIIIYVSELFLIPLAMIGAHTHDMLKYVQEIPLGVSLLTILFSRFMTFLFLRWSVEKEGKYRYDQLSGNEVFVMYGLLAFVWILLVMTGNFFLLDNSNRDSFISLLIIVTIAALFIVVYISFIDNYLTLGSKNHEIGLMQQRVEMQLEHHRHMEKDLKNLRMLQHDLRNHLLLAGTDSSYLSKILEQIETSDKYIETGNDMLNILLFEKIETALQKGIGVELFITAKDISFLDDLDICSIFGNILDNAVEACQKLSDQAEKTIELKVSSIHEFVMIVLINDCPKTEKEIRTTQPIKTTKKEKEDHGFGLKSMNSSVEKYGGLCSYVQTETKFKTQILIPVPAKTD